MIRLILLAALALADLTLPEDRPKAEGHVRTPEGPDDYCVGCGELWPCSFEQGRRAALAAASKPYNCGGPQTGQPKPHDRCNCTPRPGS